MNLDITKYVNGKRETLNPTGRAYPAVVWDFYQVDSNCLLYSTCKYIVSFAEFQASLVVGFPILILDCLFN